MSSPMTMNRVIHDAVRRDLERLVLALEAVTAVDQDRAQALERAYANLQQQLTHHHESEDRWMWPALADLGVDRDLLATMESEHQSMSTALAETAAAMGAFSRSGSAADATAARESVVRTQSVVEHHLDHEEEDLEPVIVPHFESPAWKSVEKKFRQQPLGVSGRFFAWLTDGMSEEDRAFLRSTVPPPVTFMLGRVFGRSYYRDIAQVWQATSA